MRPTRPAEGCRGGLRLPRLWRPPAAPSHPGRRRPKINDALLLWRPGLWGSRQASPDPHGLKDASSDPAQLTGWWRRWPQANIGLVTGELADSWTSTAGRMALRRLAADHDLRLEGPLAETGHWLASLPRPYRQRDHRAGHQHAGHRRRRGLRWGRSVSGSGGEESLEEQTVTLEGGAQVLGGDVVSLVPLALQPAALVGKGFGQVLHEFGHEPVGLGDR